MKILKFIANTIISCILLVLIIFLMFITSSKTLISKKNISNFIGDANILNVDVNLLFNQQEIGVTLKEKIISLGLENNIPEEIIMDILKSKEINKWLGDFFNQTINYVINRETKPQILEETINDMKTIANVSLENHINIMIEEEQLEKYIEKFCSSIVEIVPDRNEIIGNLDTDKIDDIINFNEAYLYIIISLLLILLCIINQNWYIFIKFIGITMLISGILFVIMGSMEYVITNLILNKITSMQSFILPLITNVLTIWFKSGVLVSFSSVVLILIYLTIKRMDN